MDIDEFVLAATTNDLTREPAIRDVADVIELRMDSAEDPIGQLAEYDGALPIIATNRTKWFGGEAASLGRLNDLIAAAQFDGVELVDIELETARVDEGVLRELRQADVDLIVSFHEFDETPDRDVLNSIIEECDRYGDIAKVVPFAEDLTDALTLLGAIHAATEKGIDVAGASMGEIGSHTRVVGPLYGSKIGYAPIQSDDQKYAPGQIPLRTLDSLIETMESGKEGKTTDTRETKAGTSQNFSHTD